MLDCVESSGSLNAKSLVEPLAMAFFAFAFQTLVKVEEAPHSKGMYSMLLSRSLVADPQL